MASSADRYSAYNPRQPEQDGPGPVGYLAILLAWVVPGLGHLLVGKKGRGVVFMITIHALFAAGLLLGGIRAINPPDQPIWTYTQFLAGWPMFIANKVQQNSIPYLGDPRINSRGELGDLFERERPGGAQPGDPAEQARAIQFIHDHPSFAFHPKIQDIGSVYCGIAGMLNLLVMFDVLLIVTGSIRESTRRPRHAGEASPPAAAPDPSTQTGPRAGPPSPSTGGAS